MVLWTMQGIHTERVLADPSWGEEKLPVLLDFYFTRMLPLVKERLGL